MWTFFDDHSDLLKGWLPKEMWHKFVPISLFACSLLSHPLDQAAWSYQNHQKGKVSQSYWRGLKSFKKIDSWEKMKPQINIFTETKTSSQTQESSAWAKLTTVDEEYKVIDLKFGHMGGS